MNTKTTPNIVRENEAFKIERRFDATGKAKLFFLVKATQPYKAFELDLQQTIGLLKLLVLICDDFDAEYAAIGSFGASVEPNNQPKEAIR